MGGKWQSGDQNTGRPAQPSTPSLTPRGAGGPPPPPPPPAWAPYLRVLATLVQLRQRQERFHRDVFIEDSEDKRRQGGEEEIEEDQLPVIDHGGARETAEELVPEEQVDVALQAENAALWVRTRGQPGHQVLLRSSDKSLLRLGASVSLFVTGKVV